MPPKPESCSTQVHLESPFCYLPSSLSSGLLTLLFQSCHWNPWPVLSPMNSRSTTTLASSACLALVLENCPQHIKEYGLLVICHVTLLLGVGIVPRENQDLQILLYPMLHVFVYRDLRWVQSHPAFTGGLQVFSPQHPMLPHLYAGFGLHSLTQLVWSSPQQVTLPISKDILVPLLQRQAKYSEPIPSSLILYWFLCFIWGCTKRFKMIHHFSNHLTRNQIIDL